MYSYQGRFRSLNKIILLLFTLSLELISPGKFPSISAAPKTFYVAPYGNDDNPGSLSRPWRTIAHAASTSAIKPGDTVLIREGIYNETIKQKVSGIAGAPITYRSYSGETAIISDGNSGGTYRWLILDASHIRIENITFQNYQKGAIEIRTLNGNLFDIAILNNTFINQGTPNGGNAKTIHVTTLDSGYKLYNVTIANNFFQNMDNGAKPMLQISGEIRGGMILNNTVVGTSSIAIGVSGHPDTGQPERVLIKGNNISQHGWLNDSSSGIYLNGAGKYIVIEGNIVHDGLQGIKVNLEPANSEFTTQYVIIRHNILYNNGFNLKLGVGSVSDNCHSQGILRNSVAVHNTILIENSAGTNSWFSCGENLRWKNNIFSHTGSDSGFQYRLENTTVDSSSWVVNGNFFHAAGNKIFRWENESYNSLVEFKNMTGHEQYAQQGNPLFINVTNRDFQLDPESKVRDAGIPLTSTKSGGSGTVVPVLESWYFSNGMGLQSGDTVRIGDETVLLTDVEYDNHTLIIDRSISWTPNAPVSYDYAGSNPDPGAFEFTPEIVFYGIPNDQTLHLIWSVDEDLPDESTWQIIYTSSLESGQIDDLPLSVESFTLTGLTNYEMYELSLNLIVDGEPILISKTTAMPTDIFVFLPNVLR